MTKPLSLPVLFIDYFEILFFTTTPAPRVENRSINMDCSTAFMATSFDLTGQTCIPRMEIKSFNTCKCWTDCQTVQSANCQSSLSGMGLNIHLSGGLGFVAGCFFRTKIGSLHPKTLTPGMTFPGQCSGMQELRTDGGFLSIEQPLRIGKNQEGRNAFYKAMKATFAREKIYSYKVAEWLLLR